MVNRKVVGAMFAYSNNERGHKRMSTIGKATLQSDENGLVTLQCDRCKSRFKMDCAYLNEELEGEAEKVALMEAEEAISNMLKGFKSKHVKIKTTPVKRVDRDIVCKNKDYDMHEVIVKCCNRKMALNTGDIAAGFYCAYCGRIVK